MNATFGHSPQWTVNEFLRMIDQFTIDKMLEGTGMTAKVFREEQKEEEVS